MTLYVHSVKQKGKNVKDLRRKMRKQIIDLRKKTSGLSRSTRIKYYTIRYFPWTFTIILAFKRRI